MQRAVSLRHMKATMMADTIGIITRTHGMTALIATNTATDRILASEQAAG